MPTLDDMPAQEDPVHLLLIADSKVGKSTYAAQAFIDGFCGIYVDSDNGVSALRNALKNHPEARKRVHVFNTNRPVDFMKGLLRSTTNYPFRWMPELDRQWARMAVGVSPQTVVWEFDITKVPPEWLLVQDSWTSAAADALGIGSAEQKAELLNGTDQSIYGDANVNLTFIANMLQKYPGHVIVQAHATKYEVYEKPTGVTAGEMKQKQMILRETLDVPVSSSAKHGQTMASRFNHIGWMEINGMGATEIDFTRKRNRVGGGPPDIKKPVKDLPFSKLFSTLPTMPTEVADWFRETTHESLLAEKK